jgi:hypothetical protein
MRDADLAVERPADGTDERAPTVVPRRARDNCQLQVKRIGLRGPPR